VDQLWKGKLAELPTILDSFYTSITIDYVEVEGGGEPGSGRFFHPHRLNIAKWSH